MNLQELKSDDLFVEHLIRLTEKYPYIQLNLDNSEITVSFGHETCCDADTFDEDFSGSYLVFDPCEKFVFNQSLLALEKMILNAISQNSITRLYKRSKNVLLIESKKPVSFSEETFSSNPLVDSFSDQINQLKNHLESHKRTILCVPKMREFLLESPVNISVDPIPIGKNNLTEVRVMSAFGKEYSMLNSSGIVHSSYPTTISSIESLDRKNFEIYILHEDEQSVTFEITNTRFEIKSIV